MTTEARIDAVCEFLRENVCGNIKLKKPDDDDPKHVETAMPEVYPVYLPTKGDDWLTSTPCIVVMPVKDSRSRGNGTLTLRLGFMTWSPGTRAFDGEGMKLDLNYDGWRALFAFMEQVETALTAYATVGDMEVEYPIEKGLFTDDERVPDLRPYFLGQMDVPFRYVVPQRMSEHITRLLD